LEGKDTGAVPGQSPTGKSPTGRSPTYARLAARPRRSVYARLNDLLIPVLAVFTGLLFGAVVIIISDAAAMAAFGDFFKAPGAAMAAAWHAVATAYGALWAGSIGDVGAMVRSLFSGDSKAIQQAFYPITESLTASTPYILTGLSVALAFRCGLFNIGAEGQYLIGSLTAAFVGYSITGLPWFIHLPLALLAGFAGGALWGAIPGYLKAATGAHEVVNTIMMNYIAFRLSDWLLNGPMKAPGFRPVTQSVEDTAMLPRLFSDPLRFHWGFFFALLCAYLVYWLLFKTTIGFEIRAVGANPDAARYSGMSITRNFVLSMLLAGGLAGLGGATQVLGVDRWVGQGFSAGYGFDAIAIALLGKNNPLGVVLAAILFGTLRSGATRMQSIAGIPIDIISIIQGLVIVFVAAPDIIRWLYRLRQPSQKGGPVVLTRGWGGS
jgi:general nucleoside transport system permease protein